jgi:hypothetical protein
MGISLAESRYTGWIYSIPRKRGRQYSSKLRYPVRTKALRICHIV